MGRLEKVDVQGLLGGRFIKGAILVTDSDEAYQTLVESEQISRVKITSDKNITFYIKGGFIF